MSGIMLSAGDGDWVGQKQGPTVPGLMELRETDIQLSDSVTG